VGVAFAYSLTYVGGLVLSTSVLRRRTAGLDGTVVVRHYVRLLVAAVPSAALAWLVAWLIGEAAGRGLLASLGALTAGGSVLLVGYVGTARLLHVDELTQLLRRVRRPARA
jgi:putative peptidoglycan lipid II flippase